MAKAGFIPHAWVTNTHKSKCSHLATPEAYSCSYVLLLLSIAGNPSSYNLNTPACNASGSQMFHPKLCEASSFGVKR